MLELKNSYLHYCTIGFTLILCLLYSIPNFYPDYPCITITSDESSNLQTFNDTYINENFIKQFKLQSHQIVNNQVELQFDNVTSQMQALDHLNKTMPNTYQASLHLMPSTPHWLKNLGAQPMKLGLDLQGGVHLLLQVDTTNAQKGSTIDLKDILRKMRDNNVEYQQASIINQQSVKIVASNETQLSKVKKHIKTFYPNHRIDYKPLSVIVSMSEAAQQGKTQYLVQRTLESVEKRVNELGLSEAVVQTQGRQQISVDIPGTQDINKAKSILGNTATLSFHLVKDRENTNNTLEIKDRHNHTLQVDKQAVLHGDAITYASATADGGQPLVQVRLGGGNEHSFFQATRDNVGKQLAIVLSENKIDKTTKQRQTTKTIISAPVIQQALHTNFVINGLRSHQEAETLSLLLRSGSLAAPIDIVEEMTIGPSLGSENIQKGLLSIGVGFGAIILFMVAYYRTFGLIANIGLFFNLIMILTMLSWLDATLTLPSMAAVILSVGMAVDANVLINERIREELRQGKTDIQALHLGYDKAFATILDANITTLIVSIVLYALGTGVIKGFAITLIIGLAASMFSAVYVTRIITWTVFHYLGNIQSTIGI